MQRVADISIGLRRAISAVFCVMLLLASMAQAQDARQLNLDPAHAPFNLAAFAGAIVAPRGTAWDDRMDLATLLATPPDRFAPITSRWVGFGANDAPVSVRLPLANLTDSTQSWVLAFNDASADPSEVYLVQDGDPFTRDPILVIDATHPWINADRHVHVTFDMPPNTQGTLLVTYANAASSAPMTLETPDGYLAKRFSERLHIYVLLGFLGGVTLLTLFLIGALRRYIAVFYGGYVICISMHIFATNGLFPGVFEAVLGNTYTALQSWWAIGSLSFALLFQRAFFAEDPKIGAGFRKLLLISALALLAINGGAVLGWISPLGITLVAALGVCLIGANGILGAVKRITGWWAFLVGCLTISATLLFFAFAAFFSPYLNWYEVTLILLYGVLFEAITLTFAMFAQVREIRTERETALRAELRLTQEKLEMSTRFAAAAHDIQQPLTSMRMALDKGVEAGDIGSAIDYLDNIVRTQMTDAKADILPEHHGEIAEAEDIEVAMILTQLGAMFADEAASKGLSFRVVQTSLRTNANPFALMRIVSNLVSNAIKNSQQGGVVIGCRRAGRWISIDVCGTGPGVAPTDLENLQKPYRRSGDYDGHGLGLSIVRQLCDEHGLGFDVSSQPGRGSIFRVRVPRVR